MKNDFWQKMAQTQMQQTIAQQPAHQYKTHQRINTEDVKARLQVAMVFSIVTFIVTLILCIVYASPLWLPFPVSLSVLAFLYYIEMKDAKSLQKEITQSSAQPAAHTGEAIRHIIVAELKTPTGLQSTDFELSNPRAISDFATDVIKYGKSFSEETAKKAGIKQTEFNKIRNQFINLNWAQWRNRLNRRSGIDLTDAGRAWLAEAANTPLPRA